MKPTAAPSRRREPPAPAQARRRAPLLPRRQLLQLLATAAPLSLAGMGCDCRGDAVGSSAPVPPADARAGVGPGPSGGAADGWRELAFPPRDGEAAQLATLRPAAVAASGGATGKAGGADGGQAPLLIALHGRGEAGRGLAAGARGWRDDYDLEVAIRRLGAPPLRPEDFHGFVTAARLGQLNASLAAQPYRGLTIACPYTPIVRDRSAAGAQPFARFVVEQLLPRARKEGNAQAGKPHTGIDGVSMGGRLALLVGLTRGDVFGAVGALQPAIGPREAGMLAELAARAHGEHGTRLRLVSSEEDPFLPAVQALGDALAARKLPHQVIITPGPHDYIYNRGPGAYEMLLWHERVLHGGSLPG